MNTASLVVRQAGYGLLAAARDPRAMIFTVLFPIVLLVLFNAIFKGAVPFQGHDVSYPTYFTPGIIAYSITASAFSSIAIALTSQRESGVLKRLRGAPLPPWVFIVAHIVNSIFRALIVTVLIIVIGWAAWSVGLRAETIVGLVVYLVLGVAVMCSLGIALTVVVKTADAASTVAPFSAVILSFISGVFMPISILPTWLVDIGKVFPLAPLADGLQRVFSPYTTGTGLTWENVAVLAAWGVVSLVVAARGFRWEPQAARS